MNKQQIMKDNKLIAEFMGFETYPDIVDDRTRAYDVGDYIKADNSTNENDENIFHPDDMQFHTSWDWLMPVIEEIDHTSYEPIESIEDGIATRSLEMTYKAVVEYIKKYER